MQGRVDTSQCLWFLEPYTLPQHQHRQQRGKPAAKQLTIVLEKHRAKGAASAAEGGGAHWGAVFDETAAAEAAAAAYDPYPNTGGPQANPFADSRLELESGVEGLGLGV